MRLKEKCQTSGGTNITRVADTELLQVPTQTIRTRHDQRGAETDTNFTTVHVQEIQQGKLPLICGAFLLLSFGFLTTTKNLSH